MSSNQSLREMFLSGGQGADAEDLWEDFKVNCFLSVPSVI